MATWQALQSRRSQHGAALQTGRYEWLRCLRQHGGKAGEASKAIMAQPYDPAAAYARKAKRAKHQAYVRLRNAGAAPKPVLESMQRFEKRLDREHRAERRHMEQRGLVMADQEWMFRGGRVPTVRRSTLFGGTIEEESPRKPLRPLYPC
jgi:hypothetical protein